MEKGQLWTVVSVALIVAVVASLVTASITGNVIRLNQDRLGKYKVYTVDEVYSKEEIDAKLKGIVVETKTQIDGALSIIQYKLRNTERVYAQRTGETCEDVCIRYRGFTTGRNDELTCLLGMMITNAGLINGSINNFVETIDILSSQQPSMVESGSFGTSSGSLRYQIQTACYCLKPL